MYVRMSCLYVMALVRYESIVYVLMFCLSVLYVCDLRVHGFFMRICLFYDCALCMYALCICMICMCAMNVRCPGMLSMYVYYVDVYV